MIPEELQKLPQWTYSYSEDEPKRPTHTKYIPEKGLTYQQAIKYEQGRVNVGLYTTDRDPYVLGDIDHIDDISNPFGEMSIELVKLLTAKPTYMEISPSGHGFRFIYKFINFAEKSKVSGKNFLSIEGQRDAQINIGPPWMRMTGKESDLSSGDVALITWEELEKVFKISYAGEDDASLRNVTSLEVIKTPFSEIESHVMRIPLDQNPRIQRAFSQVFHTEYHHYTFWLKILMALHCYAQATEQMVECMSLAVKWSSTDPTEYTGEEDVIDRWKSFSVGKCEMISHKTLFKLANLSTLIWPSRRALKKGQSKSTPRLPLNSEIVNYKYFLDFYGVTIYVDVGNPSIYYLTGDEDALDKFFLPGDIEKMFEKFYGPFDMNRLVSSMLPWCQKVGFIGLSRNTLKDQLMTIIHNNSKKFDPVEYYFSTPFEELPESYKENTDFYHRSTFDDLFDCLDIDYMTSNHDKELVLYRDYYKKWLLGLIRSMYYKHTDAINNCVLLLTGSEQIRKTSHFRYILPKWMRKHYIAFTTHGFSNSGEIRDITKIAATTRIVVWDEFDRVLTQQTESNLKKVIDNIPQTIIDKYETIPRTIEPVAIYGGTSNLRELKLGDEGSRRLFHIPVKWVHTDQMDRICWHKLINDLYEEAKMELKKGVTPWLLSQDQLHYQRNLHGLLRSKNNVDVMLEETFDFSGNAGIQTGVLIGVSSVQGDRSGRLMSTKQVSDILSRYHTQAYNVSRPALTHSLKRLCSQFTRTTNQPQAMVQPQGYVEKGVFHQGPHKKWVMPPLIDGINGAFDTVM